MRTWTPDKGQILSAGSGLFLAGFCILNAGFGKRVMLVSANGSSAFSTPVDRGRNLFFPLCNLLVTLAVLADFLVFHAVTFWLHSSAGDGRKYACLLAQTKKAPRDTKPLGVAHR
jgi:hypothetical protein